MNDDEIWSVVKIDHQANVPRAIKPLNPFNQHNLCWIKCYNRKLQNKIIFESTKVYLILGHSE